MGSFDEAVCPADVLLFSSSESCTSYEELKPVVWSNYWAVAALLYDLHNSHLSSQQMTKFYK